MPGKLLTRPRAFAKGALTKVSEPGRGRLVPAKLRAIDKPRGRVRPHPILQRTLASVLSRRWHGGANPRDLSAHGLWLAIFFFAHAVRGWASNADPDVASPKFLGAQSCSSSSCHGGAGSNRNQYLIWSTRDFHHLRPYATLETARSERIAEVLRIGNPSQNHRCTVCHAPYQTVPTVQLRQEAKISEGVSCENCHGPAESWLRAHTRPDWSREDRVHAGMRDLKNLYVRANTCVACHQNVDSDLQQAGHPELIFELDGQAVSQPRHGRRSMDKPGPQIWLVGQAVALREMSWQLAREKSPSDKLADRAAGLFWLVQAASKAEVQWPQIEPNAFAPGADQMQKIQLWSDQFAKGVSEFRWSEELTRKCLSLLAGTGGAFGETRIPAPLHARRAERLVLGLDRLVTGLGNAAADPALSRALDRLFDAAQSLPDFDPNKFADNLNEFHTGVSRILDSR